MILGVIYKEYITEYLKKIQLSVIKKSLIDIIIILLLIFYLLNFNHGNVSNQIIGIPLISFIIIYLTIHNNGLIKIILTNKVNLFLSNISFECYLIHYVLCIFLTKYFYQYSFTIMGIIYTYVMLLVGTIILSLLYKTILKKISDIFSKL